MKLFVRSFLIVCIVVVAMSFAAPSAVIDSPPGDVLSKCDSIMAVERELVSLMPRQFKDYYYLYGTSHSGHHRLEYPGNIACRNCLSMSDSVFCSNYVSAVVGISINAVYDVDCVYMLNEKNRYLLRYYHDYLVNALNSHTYEDNVSYWAFYFGSLEKDVTIHERDAVISELKAKSRYGFLSSVYDGYAQRWFWDGHDDKGYSREDEMTVFWTALSKRIEDKDPNLEDNIPRIQAYMYLINRLTNELLYALPNEYEDYLSLYASDSYLDKIDIIGYLDSNDYYLDQDAFVSKLINYFYNIDDYSLAYTGTIRNAIVNCVRYRQEFVTHYLNQQPEEFNKEFWRKLFSLPAEETMINRSNIYSQYTYSGAEMYLYPETIYTGTHR